MAGTKVYVVTGANSGVGKDASRQLALRDDTKIVYLACRSKDKAEAAIHDLVTNAGVLQSKLAFVQFDASETKSQIQHHADTIPESFIDGIILNAGGFGPDTHGQPNAHNGVTSIAQLNLIGHVHYVHHLLKQGKLGKRDGRQTRMVYSGTEGARGVKLMGVPPPLLEQYTTSNDFVNLLNGTTYGEKYDKTVAYGDIKGMGALYFAEFARQFPDMYVTTISPGGTTGTNFKDATAISTMERILFTILLPVFGLLGLMHGLQVGTKRYVDGVTGEDGFLETFPSGTFVASKDGALCGPLSDQAEDINGKAYGDPTVQKNVYLAVQTFA